MKTTDSNPKRRRRKYRDEVVFALWQAGMTDAEIAEAVGVHRTVIQRWRDVMELPSTSRIVTNTKRYHLRQMEDGTYYVVKI